jgi:MYND finger
MAQQRQRRQQGKSQHLFETLFAAGRSLAGERSADKFLRAVRAAPSVWTKHRFYLFSMVLGFKIDECTPEFIDEVTEQFVDNKIEPAHFRSLAALWAAKRYVRYTPIMNVSTAVELCRQGLDIIATSSGGDEDRHVLYHPYVYLYGAGDLGRDADFRLKYILVHIREEVENMLSTFARSTPEAGRPQPGHVETLSERAKAGGLMCDCCGKTLVELQVVYLERCERCKMIFYCSKKCQKVHWRHKGHREACRAPGQIVIGDLMLLILPVGSEEDFTFVNVISSLGGNRWQVKDPMSNELLTVEGPNLVHYFRPPSTLYTSASGPVETSSSLLLSREGPATDALVVVSTTQPITQEPTVVPVAQQQILGSDEHNSNASAVPQDNGFRCACDNVVLPDDRAALPYHCSSRWTWNANPCLYSLACIGCICSLYSFYDFPVFVMLLLVSVSIHFHWYD